MAFSSLRDFLRHLFGGNKKKKSVFASEKEARAFVEKTYQETGGVTPELRRAYEFYKQNYDDHGAPGRR